MKFNCRGGSTGGGQGGQLPPLSFYLYYINDMKGGVSLHNWSISLLTDNSASKIWTQKIIYYCA